MVLLRYRCIVFLVIICILALLFHQGCEEPVG